MIRSLCHLYRCVWGDTNLHASTRRTLLQQCKRVLDRGPFDVTIQLHSGAVHRERCFPRIHDSVEDCGQGCFVRSPQLIEAEREQAGELEQLLTIRTET